MVALPLTLQPRWPAGRRRPPASAAALSVDAAQRDSARIIATHIVTSTARSPRSNNRRWPSSRAAPSSRSTSISAIWRDRRERCSRRIDPRDAVRRSSRLARAQAAQQSAQRRREPWSVTPCRCKRTKPRCKRQRRRSKTQSSFTIRTRRSTNKDTSPRRQLEKLALADYVSSAADV